MKRFYKAAAVEEVDGGFGISLDGRPVRTPARAALRVPSRALAEALCEEWNAQGETVDPRSMPLTQLANTAVDRMPAARRETVAELVRYGETDLLCHRAERPGTLADRQEAVWQPLLDRLQSRHGIALRAVSGMLPQPQDPHSMARLERVVGACGDFELTALHLATTSAGSIAIGLAAIEGDIAAGQAAEAAFLDECYQIERWGADAEAEARLSQGRDDIALAYRFAALLRARTGASRQP
ncbi:MAG: ATPase [Rhodospirillaceae bacterium]|nr:ATPase [Rhodospirillaceae bacterium]